jgi:hypothetical protein
MGVGHPVEYLNPSLIDYQPGGRDDFMRPTPTAYVERLKVSAGAQSQPARGA